MLVSEAETNEVLKALTKARRQEWLKIQKSPGQPKGKEIDG